MATYETVNRFEAEFSRLTDEQRAAFVRMVKLFREGLESRTFHPQLGVKGFRNCRGVYEMRWADDGRALWCYGDTPPGKVGPHIIWLRIGTHDIYKNARTGSRRTARQQLSSNRRNWPAGSGGAVSPSP